MPANAANLSQRDAIALTERLLAEFFPDADFAFVAGSVMRGAATPSSDIDLVVIHARLPHAHRQSLLFGGVPFEAFVHDPATLRWFFAADVRAGRPVLMRLVAEGVAVGPRPDEAERLRQEAEALLEKGPPTLDREALDRMRYVITDLLTDLHDERPAAETMAIGVALYPAMAEFLLRANGRWTGAGKWLQRQLAVLDPLLAGRFEVALRALVAHGEPGPILALAETILAPHGGLLFEGYRSDAPAGWRLERSTV